MNYKYIVIGNYGTKLERLFETMTECVEYRKFLIESGFGIVQDGVTKLQAPTVSTLH